MHNVKEPEMIPDAGEIDSDLPSVSSFLDIETVRGLARKANFSEIREALCAHPLTLYALLRVSDDVVENAVRDNTVRSKFGKSKEGESQYEAAIKEGVEAIHNSLFEFGRTLIDLEQTYDDTTDVRVFCMRSDLYKDLQSSAKKLINDFGLSIVADLFAKELDDLPHDLLQSQLYRKVIEHETYQIRSKLITDGFSDARKARDILTDAFTPFIESISKGACSFDGYKEDAIQFGKQGFMRGVETYDLEKGTLVNYTRDWILKYVREGILNMTKVVYIPKDVRTLIGKVFKTESELGTNIESQNFDDEIASRLSISLERLGDVRKATVFDGPVISLEALCFETTDDLLPSGALPAFSVEGSAHPTVCVNSVTQALESLGLTPLEAESYALRLSQEEGSPLEEILEPLNKACQS